MPPRGGGNEARIPGLLGQKKSTEALERIQGAPQLHVRVKTILGLSKNIVFNSEKQGFMQSWNHRIVEVGKDLSDHHIQAST